MSLPARLTFVSGFFYYVYTALLIFFGPLLPVIMLVFLPDEIRLRNFVILLPAFVIGAVLYPLWHRAPYGPSVWPLGIARGWAHVFSLWDGAWGKSMSWHPTRDPGKFAAPVPDRGHLVERRHGRALGTPGHLAVGLGLAGSPLPCCSSGCSTSPSSAASSSLERRQHEIPTAPLIGFVVAACVSLVVDRRPPEFRYPHAAHAFSLPPSPPRYLGVL